MQRNISQLGWILILFVYPCALASSGFADLFAELIDYYRLAKGAEVGTCLSGSCSYLILGERGRVLSSFFVTEGWGILKTSSSFTFFSVWFSGCRRIGWVLDYLLPFWAWFQFNALLEWPKVFEFYWADSGWKVKFDSSFTSVLPFSTSSRLIKSPENPGPLYFFV